MTVCIEQKTKKYKLRGSPPYSAMDCKDSTKKGNDGLTYASKSDKKGIYRWVKMNQLIKNKTIKKTNVPSQNNTKCVYKKKVYGSVDVSKFIKCILNDTLKKQLEGVLNQNVYTKSTIMLHFHLSCLIIVDVQIFTVIISTN